VITGAPEPAEQPKSHNQLLMEERKQVLMEERQQRKQVLMEELQRLGM